MSSPLVCVGFLSPLYVTRSINSKNEQVDCLRTTTLSSGLSQAAFRLGFTRLPVYQKTLYALQPPAKALISISLRRGEHIMCKSHQSKLKTPAELNRVHIYYPTASPACTDIVIQGYWVGPDFEDGWGYVEATINQDSQF